MKATQLIEKKFFFNLVDKAISIFLILVIFGICLATIVLAIYVLDQLILLAQGMPIYNDNSFTTKALGTWLAFLGVAILGTKYFH